MYAAVSSNIKIIVNRYYYAFITHKKYEFTINPVYVLELAWQEIVIADQKHKLEIMPSS